MRIRRKYEKQYKRTSITRKSRDCFLVGDRESSLTVSKEQLIELIKLAEKTGSLPKLPTEWWEKVSKQS